MYTETIRNIIADKLKNNKKINIEISNIIDKTLEENKILHSKYGYEIVQDSIFFIAQTIADRIEQTQ